jgi:hypothetical protein
VKRREEERRGEERRDGGKSACAYVCVAVKRAAFLLGEVGLMVSMTCSGTYLTKWR